MENHPKLVLLGIRKERTEEFMNMRRLPRALICLLTLLLVLAALPVGAGAEEIASGQWGELSWTLDDQGALTISVTADNVSAVAMRSLTEGSTDAWLAHREQIRTVTIGERITSVSSYAFAGCGNLSQVTFSGTVQNIYQRAFQNCTALESIHLPGTVSVWANAFTGCTGLRVITQDTDPAVKPVMKSSAFAGCPALAQVTLSDNVASIGANAFADCKATLESVNIPSGMAGGKTGKDMNMAEGLFADCTRLTSVTIPAGVHVSKNAFAGCTGLTSVTFGGGEQNLGELAFSGCTGLTELTVPSGTYPSKGCFNGCTGLETVTLEEGLSIITQEVFQNCTGLTTLHLPASVTSVYANAFAGCDGLSTIRYGGTPEQWEKILILSGNDALNQNPIYPNHEHSYSNGFCTAPGCEAPYEAAQELGENTWGITNGGQLYWFAQRVDEGDTTANAVLQDNITVNTQVLENGAPVADTTGLRTWNAIGDNSSSHTPYVGTFDGNGKTVSGLYFQNPQEGNWIGLISTLGEGGTVKNVTLTDSYFYGAEKIGGIVGYNLGGTITGCENRASIAAEGKFAGGIVGSSYDGRVEDCRNSGTVTGATGYIGGIAGENYGSTGTPVVKNCTNSGTITCTASAGKVTKTYVGGVVGRNYHGTVEACANSGAVTNGARGCYTGGVVGYNDKGTVTDCANTAAISGYTEVGGVLGYTSGTVASCRNTGAVSATTCAGGIAGEARAVSMSLCGNLGTVTCTGSSGQAGGLVGLVGSKTSQITDCFNAGAVTGEKEVGGLAGHGEYAVIRNAFNAGIVRGNGKRTGALVGWETGDGSFQNCYYLEGCATDGGQTPQLALGSATVGSAEADGEGMKAEKMAVFASGELAWRLNQTTSAQKPVWKQTIGQDTCPNFTGKTVYYGYLSCREDAPAQYTNNPNATAQPEHMDENGDYKCDTCGMELEKPRAVTRIQGSHRYDTARKTAEEMKEALGVEKFDAIILASGRDFADALAGSYLSAVKKAPILLSYGLEDQYAYLDDENIAYIRENLAENGMVYLLGGEAAVPASYEAALPAGQIKRLGGRNRYETNRKILEEAGVAPGSEILVCTGIKFADSLSAAATGKPILLVQNYNDVLYGVDKDFLSGLENCTFTIVGGTAAVGDEFVEALGGFDKVRRLAGANRFATSVLVAETYFEHPAEAVLAFADDFPDGLCGGALACTRKAPLILVMDGFESRAVTYAAANGITSGMVLGGNKLISDAGVRSIFAMPDGDEILVK